jgi:hypothetical protein
MRVAENSRYRKVDVSSVLNNVNKASRDALLSNVNTSVAVRRRRPVANSEL